MIPTAQIIEPEVRDLAEDARRFVSSHDWCKCVTAVRLAWAAAGVLGVFQVDLESNRVDVDPTLWVVVGDIPPAYLVLDEAPTWREALRGYVAEMSLWVDAVRRGLPIDEVIPVEAEPPLENAEALAGRLAFIETDIIDTNDGEAESDA